MRKSKRLIFELNTIHDRAQDICNEYNQTLGVGNEPIQDIIKNLNEGYIRIRFDTYAYMVFIYKEAYIFSWFRKVSGDRFVQDGAVTCNDVSQVIRELNDRIFSVFSPRRGLRWYQFGVPKQFKRNKKRA